MERQPTDHPVDTAVPGFTIRLAAENDAAVVLDFIQRLAEYERLSQECVATEAALRETLFGGQPYAEVLLGEFHGTPTCFALFFHNYSTFLAMPGIYLEDLFVKPEWRSRGFGRALLTYLARLAVDRGCGRLEWSVLDWNTDATRFYERLGAVAMDDWTTMRISGPRLEALARSSGNAPKQ